MLLTAWPLFGLRIHCRDVTLRLVLESDLPHLAAIQPDENEHDPGAEMFPALDLDQNRARLVHQDYWRSMGTWSPTSWGFGMAVVHDDAVVGLQALRAERFPTLRTVDTGSWLRTTAQGQGIGVAARMGVLGLAFAQLDALAAVSSARTDNAASIGVSRRIGYLPNGVSLTDSDSDSDSGLTTLQHLRLTAQDWGVSGLREEVVVEGFEPCRPWFGLD